MDIYYGKTLFHSPQSIRYCRPIKLEYTKETTAKIQEERDSLASEISRLTASKIDFDGQELTINFDLRLTVIDGKALQAITEVTLSSQAYPLCGASPKSFNILENLENGSFAPKSGTLVHGVCPLHCWIRLFEFCLRLAYRRPSGVYPVTRERHKKKFLTTKKRIQSDLRSAMGILVDVVKQGYGTTNDGNMARKAFQNHQEFAKILQIDPQFVWRLYVILTTMSSQFSINPEKFGEFCADTHTLYVGTYKWHPMSVTLHRVLVHSKEIIENSILPLGLMGEDAAESRNKLHRQDREFHARQMSRVMNLTDIFHRALESSDPLISSHFLDCRRKLRQRIPLPSEVINLLQNPIAPPKWSKAVDVDEEVADDNPLQDMLDDLFTEAEDNDEA